MGLRLVILMLLQQIHQCCLYRFNEKNGEQKDTAKNILTQENFVVHIVSDPYLTQINETAASLPPGESEITLAQLTSVLSEEITTPGIKEAKVRYECVLENTYH